MLFESGVAAYFESLNASLNALSTTERKTETAKRLNFYYDDQLTQLTTQLEALFADPSNMIKVELNIVKKIIKSLAQTYRDRPIRNIEGAGKDKEIYKKITEDCALDVKMKQVSRLVKLCKTILVKVVFRQGKIDLDILTGNILDVVTGDSPQELKEVLVTDYGDSGRLEEVEYSYWTPESFQRLDYQGRAIKDAKNPYHVLPFITIFDYAPTGSDFWLQGGADLISLQEAVNIKLTDLIYLIQQQSFGVGYIKGGSPGGGSVKVDPGTLVELRENGEIGFVSQEAKINDVVNAIDKIVKWAAVSNGLSADAMMTEPREESGVAKLVGNRELDELRSDDVALFRVYERQLFDLVRIVNNVHSRDKLSKDAAMLIDFADIESSVDPETQSKAWDLQLNQGVISQVDIALKLNKDLRTREDALAYLMKVKEETRALIE